MIEQRIVESAEMSDFLESFREKQMNLNILTVQPYSFVKGDDGIWRVKKYLWVYIPIIPEQMTRPMQSPIVMPKNN